MMHTFQKTTAFSLVEVTLALGLSTFCLIAIFGLLPVGLKSNQAATEQSVASGILSAVAADLRATPQASTPGQAARSRQFGMMIPANPVSAALAPSTLYFTSSGQCLQTPSEADTRYRLSVRFLPNGSAAKSATFLTLQVSWPAAADPAEAEGSSQIFLALDRN